MDSKKFNFFFRFISLRPLAFSLQPVVLALVIFLSIAVLTSAEPVQLAPTVSTIAKQFLADRQKPEPPSGEATSAPEPQSPSQNDEKDNSFAPLKITLSTQLKVDSLPKWAIAPFIDKESSSIEIPIPALAEQSDIENFAITINFYDMGDGGPLVEKQSKQDENPTLLCSGLGINGPALGLNSRTIAIPADVALDGGKIIVHHVGRFEQIHSIILRPGRTAMVSVLSDHFFPAIMDESTVIEQEEANGATLAFKKGNITHGRITSAELSAPIEQLDGTLEFAFDISGHPEATIFCTEIQGLDLEAHIEVLLNGIIIGPLNIASFQLDSPELISATINDDHTAPLQFAGWRKAHLYIPSYLWKEKKSDSLDTTDQKNHLVLIVRPGPRSSGSKIHLKNSYLEVLHGTAHEEKK